MNIEQTVKDMWATRPHRRAADRKIAGVAAAIGRRYAVDPVLVRVAFVVGAVFSGVGLLLYLLGWLLLPAEGDETSAAESLLGKGRSSVSPVVTALLGLALIPTTAGVLGGDAFGLIGLAVAGAALVMLHRSRAALGEVPPTATGTLTTPVGPTATPTTSATPGVGTTPRTPGTTATGTTATSGPSAMTGTTPTAGTAPAAGATGQAGRGAGDDPATSPPRTPPAWDPLGAAPFAWDLPEPTPVPPEAPVEPCQRSMVTPFTLGLALLAVGLAAGLGHSLTLAQIVAVGLAVVGVGLVAGSLVRGGRGLIGVAIILAVLTWVLQAVPGAGFIVGERRWQPATVADLSEQYHVTIGNARLDLSDLPLTNGQEARTTVTVGIGETRVLVPRTADVQLTCSSPIGAVDCLGVDNSGLPARATTTDHGPDGPGGGTLVLDVRSGIGNVAVDRE